MTPLRSKMIDDMQAAGLGASTQAVYIRVVRAVAVLAERGTWPPEIAQRVHLTSHALVLDVIMVR